MDFPPVIYEDNHLLAVNKPNGMLVQGDNTGDMPLSELAKLWLKEKYQKPGNVFCGVVHRLDRPVSGVVVLAKTSKALSRMNELFRDRETGKTYWAVTRGRPAQPNATLVHWLEKNEEKNKATVYSTARPNTWECRLDYELIAEKNGLFLLEVRPLTGRPHQIRAQLAQIKCPIVGDFKYGSKETLDGNNIMLHARKLDFVHPVQKENLSLLAPTPKNAFWGDFERLG